MRKWVVLFVMFSLLIPAATAIALGCARICPAT